MSPRSRAELDYHARHAQLYRQQHPEQVKATRKALYESQAAFLRGLKIGKSCVDCGLDCTEANFPAFDWDHRPGEIKRRGVGNLAGYDEQTILAEIAKCDLRCKNCHAVITHQRRLEAAS